MAEVSLQTSALLFVCGTRRKQFQRLQKGPKVVGLTDAQPFAQTGIILVGKLAKIRENDLALVCQGQDLDPPVLVAGGPGQNPGAF